MEKYIIPRFDKERILKDWWEGTKFFLGKSFYQGRRDIISAKVEERVMKVLNEYIEENGGHPEIILEKENLDDIKVHLKKVIGKGKIGRGRDVEMVISILDYLSNISNENIIRYSIDKIKSRNLKEHFLELQKIFSIGPKISSFYIRDLISIYNLEDEISKTDWIFLQPVDTWVRKVSFKVGIIDDENEKDRIVREKIVEACLHLGLSPIKYNQGAWYIGYNSLDIVLDNLEIINL